MTQHVSTVGMAFLVEKSTERLHADRVAQFVLPMMWSGATPQSIADALNSAGITTAQSELWLSSEFHQTIQKFSK
jgi:hypothetical protein